MARRGGIAGGLLLGMPRHGTGTRQGTRHGPMLGGIARRHGKATGDSFVNATRGLSPTVACIEPGGCVVEPVTGTCATVAAQIAIWYRNMIQCPPLSYTLNIILHVITAYILSFDVGPEYQKIVRSKESSGPGHPGDLRPGSSRVPARITRAMQ